MSDTGGWNADHNPDPCSLPYAYTTEAIYHTANRSLAFIFRKVDDGYGGARIGKTFQQNWPNGGDNVTYSELYIRYYIMFDSNFRFPDSTDIKSTFAHMTTGQHTYQSVYQGSDSSHFGLRFFWWGGGAAAPFSDNVDLSLSVWHLLEWHLVYGASAGTTYMQAKADGTVVNWAGYGTIFYCPSADYSWLGEFESFALDNTINNGTLFASIIPGDAHIYWDDIKINNGDGWIGATEESPPSPADLQIQMWR